MKRIAPKNHIWEGIKMSDKGLQLNETQKMASDFIDQMISKFGEKMKNFIIQDVTDNPNHRAFSITFEMYNYFNVILNYGRGHFGCAIINGDHHGVSLKNSQEWWDEADFNIFFKELEKEIELRIPEKYLKANGWK
jgi:hypothetical protein